jgi:hypothetical protein
MFLSVSFCSFYSLKTANFRELGCPYTQEAISFISPEIEMAKNIHLQMLTFIDVRYGKTFYYLNSLWHCFVKAQR